MSRRQVRLGIGLLKYVWGSGEKKRTSMVGRTRTYDVCTMEEKEREPIKGMGIDWLIEKRLPTIQGSSWFANH